MIHSMSADLTLMIVLVVLLVAVATIIIGGLYFLNKGIKEQYVYNHTALPSLDEEKEEQQKAAEEQYHFESILGDKPTRKSDWSDFHTSPADELEETVIPEVTTLPEVESSHDTTDQAPTRRQTNSLPDLS